MSTPTDDALRLRDHLGERFLIGDPRSVAAAARDVANEADVFDLAACQAARESRFPQPIPRDQFPPRSDAFERFNGLRRLGRFGENIVDGNGPPISVRPEIGTRRLRLRDALRAF
jgi:hypothetical protein